jgi:hypothetical protein
MVWRGRSKKKEWCSEKHHAFRKAEFVREKKRGLGGRPNGGRPFFDGVDIASFACFVLRFFVVCLFVCLLLVCVGVEGDTSIPPVKSPTQLVLFFSWFVLAAHFPECYDARERAWRAPKRKNKSCLRAPKKGKREEGQTATTATRAVAT